MKKYKAISIVAPHGENIANGLKTIEVRSWTPTIPLHEDLLVIQNYNYLRKEGETDPNGKAMALVKIKKVRDYLETDIEPACASRWDEGYFSWVLYDVRPIRNDVKVLAAREIYEIEANLEL